MELDEKYIDHIKQGLKHCLTPAQTQDYLIRQINHAYLTGKIHSFIELVESENNKIANCINQLKTTI